MASRLCSKRWKAGSLPSNLLVVLEPQRTSASSESRRRKCAKAINSAHFHRPVSSKNELLKRPFRVPSALGASLLGDDHEKARRTWLRCRAFHIPDRAKRPAVCASAGWLSDTTV